MRMHFKHSWFWQLLAGLGLLGASLSCTTSGTAVGELKTPSGQSGPVTLQWKSSAAEPERGTMAGVLPDGTHVAGDYFQVVETADADIYAPAWVGWRPYWPGWHPYWYAGPYSTYDWSGFVRIYTGRVIANLQSDDQKIRMRCRFELRNPRQGLVGGGSGDCQLSNGASIQQVNLASG